MIFIDLILSRFEIILVHAMKNTMHGITRFSASSSSKVNIISLHERLSVMHQPARLPENFDQISPKHPCSGILHRTPLPWKLKLFPESKSGLTQNTLPPRKWKTLTFFPEFRSELTQNTPQPPLKIENSNFLY